MKKVEDIFSKKKRIEYWEGWAKSRLDKPRNIALMINKKEELADYDSLTRVLNRRGLLNYLSVITHLLSRSDQKMALMFIDVDKLKKINDTEGHKAGDKVILTVAQCLKKSIRASDFVGRWGGDEFIVVLTDVRDKEAVDKVVDRINLCLAAHTSVTIGVAYWDKKLEIASLIEMADQGMYKAKKSKTKVFIVNKDNW